MATTDRIPQMRIGFHPRRAIDVSIDAPTTSSDGGVLLLRQVDERLGLSAKLAPILVDDRVARLAEPRPIWAISSPAPPNSCRVAAVTDREARAARRADACPRDAAPATVQ